MSVTITGATGKTITLKHGEIKQLKFTYTQGGVSLDISAAALTLTLKEDVDDSAPALQILDADFTKLVNVATGTLDTATITPEKKYVAEMQTVFGVSSLDKCETFFVEIERAINS